MAEEKAEGGEEKAAKPKRNIDMGVVLALVNTLAILAALGTAVYTKVLYKKQAIEEKEEFEKIAEAEKNVGPAEKQIVSFEQMTVNIAPSNGKVHYVTLTVNIETRDTEVAAATKATNAILVDRFIEIISKKQLSELNTIQGKLILKTELIREFNHILKTTSGAEVGITDIFFSEFILQ